MDQEDKYLQRWRCLLWSKYMTIKIEYVGKIPQGYLVGMNGEKIALKY